MRGDIELEQQVEKLLCDIATLEIENRRLHELIIRKDRVADMVAKTIEELLELHG